MRKRRSSPSNSKVLTPKEFRIQVERSVREALADYAEDGSIATQADLDHLAPKLAYRIIQKEHGNTKFSSRTPGRIGSYIVKYFQKYPTYSRVSGKEDSGYQVAAEPLGDAQ